MNSELDRHVDLVVERVVALGWGTRRVVAIAGPPASGKSTLAERVVARLNERVRRSAALVPMDGWHLDNPILEERMMRHIKGAPKTFDALGFCRTIEILARRREEAFVPRFDRDRDIAIGSALRIAPEVETLIVEGNYLLFQEEPWPRLAESIDLSVFLAPTLEVLRTRLAARWEEQGYTAEQIVPQIASDLFNAERVLNHSAEADLRLGGESHAE